MTSHVIVETNDNPSKTSWQYTSKGENRGYIQAHALEELWFHTGTACNLRCPFCLEGSKPGDTRLEQPHLEEVRPLMDEALTMGVRQFSFTGGEPFVNRGMASMLAYALQHRPCLVLSNGTAPLQRRFDELLPLLELPNPLRIRISLDAPEAAPHDAGRGAGNFDRALQSLRTLHDAGFPVSVARLIAQEEDQAAVEAAYQRVFKDYGLPASLPIVAFPDFHPPGSDPDDLPEITEHCMTTYHNAEGRAAFMCAYSRMVVKIAGRMRVYACTLVDDDPAYDLGDTLHAAMRPRVMLRHHRCYSCFAYGASCSER